MKRYVPQEAQKLADTIAMHKEAYYKGFPLISDQEYDSLEEELRSIHPNHPILQKVGAEPIAVAKKVAHEVAMLSLAKTYKIEDLLNWQENRLLVAAYKIDGNSLSLIYNKGHLTIAKTRGNGLVGEDVTEKARWVSECVPYFKSPHNEENIEIRGELYCRNDHFLALANEMTNLGLPRPTNPRNTVAGVLGRKQDLQLARHFGFFAFDIQAIDGRSLFATEWEKLSYMEKAGFKIPHAKKVQSKAEITSYIDEALTSADSMPFNIDGVVFSFDETKLHQSLGSTSHHPRYRLSFKWPGEIAESEIEEIQWFTSRLGIVTPVAQIKPVYLSGAQIKNVTLHNAAFVLAYNLKAGDTIEIIRSGEVIPKFLRLVLGSDKKAQLPKTCPSCQSELFFDDVRLICQNIHCEAKRLGFILNWIRCADIEDISEKRLEVMMELLKVRHPADLYLLQVADFLQLPATKKKMAQKLYDNIQKSKQIKAARFLTGLGISGMGHTMWQDLLRHFKTIEAITEQAPSTIQTEVRGFAEKMATQVVMGLKEAKTDIKKLLAAGVIPYYENMPKTAHPLAGTTIAITGSLSKPRLEIEEELTKLGIKMASSVTAKTKALVTNEKNSNSSKYQKALALNIPIWTEAELLEKLAKGKA